MRPAGVHGLALFVRPVGAVPVDAWPIVAVPVEEFEAIEEALEPVDRFVKRLPDDRTNLIDWDRERIIVIAESA